MMKKLLALAMALVMVLAMAACGGEAPASSEASSAESASEPASEPASEAAPESSSEAEAAPAGDEVPATVPDVTVTDVLFTPPEGFTQAEDGSMVYTAPDGSNIQVQYQEVETAGMSTATDTQQLAADMEAELEAQFAQLVGEEVDVIISECSLVAVDGMPGIRVATSYDLAGVPVSQLSYTISADGIYTFTFTQMGDAGWMDAFEASAQTIDFVTE